MKKVRGLLISLTSIHSLTLVDPIAACDVLMLIVVWCWCCCWWFAGRYNACALSERKSRFVGPRTISTSFLLRIYVIKFLHPYLFHLLFTVKSGELTLKRQENLKSIVRHCAFERRSNNGSQGKKSNRGSGTFYKDFKWSLPQSPVKFNSIHRIYSMLFSQFAAYTVKNVKKFTI